MVNNTNNFETPGEDQVSRLLGTLERIEAPGDFDIRVRARIANGRTQRSSGWLSFPVKVAMPLAVFAVVGGYVGFSSLNREDAPSPVVARYAEPVAAAPVESAPTAPMATTASAPPVEAPIVAAVDPKKTVEKPAVNAVDKRVVTAPDKDEPVGGSVDRAGREITVITPGAANTNTDRPPVTAEESRISAKQLLSRIGISATPSGSGWLVQSVGGAASKAGILAGDVIEAVNGEPLGSAASFGNRAVARTLRVRREGKVIRIDVKG